MTKAKESKTQTQEITDPAKIIMDSFKTIKTKKDNEVDDALAKSLMMLISMLNNVKDYKKSELRLHTMLNTDKDFRRLLSWEEQNRKHIDRKHEKSIMKAIENISKAIAVEYNMNKQVSFWGRIKNFFGSGGDGF
ncbi:MAG: hypothetical protein GF311_26630 [Candidatus Lokiarchaeota archaeon]|nr:hypothetical protein [Candidatus Lokiarchaeota archaeon]